MKIQIQQASKALTQMNDVINRREVNCRILELVQKDQAELAKYEQRRKELGARRPR
jgi:hypothetical protein